MEWNTLIDLILNSIQIIGIFIAIIIGLIISKVIDLKKEKSEIVDILSDIDNELKTTNEQFEQLKEDNYIFYKNDNVYDMVNSILEQEEYQFNDNIPYVNVNYQKDFFEYVKQYMVKVYEKQKNEKDLEECKKELKIENNSIEEVIVEEMYDWRG
jgi:uncharacterized membrane protein YraQ (UPF0718 family)